MNTDCCFVLFLPFFFCLLNFPLQECTRVFNSLNNGDFGDADCVAEYKKKCSRQFPYAFIFKNIQTLSYLQSLAENHMESSVIQSHECSQTSPTPMAQPATQQHEQSTSELKWNRRIFLIQYIHNLWISFSWRWKKKHTDYEVSYFKRKEIIGGRGKPNCKYFTNTQKNSWKSENGEW